MKIKTFLIIGLSLAFAPVAHAQTALSPWVQQVLERADEGISNAGSRPASTACDDITKKAEYENTLSFIRERTNAISALEVEVWQLRERTVCYESDRKKILNKMKEVLEELKDVVENCEFGKGHALSETYDFLAGAYETFLKGGANPAYRDDRLRKTYPFQDSSLSEPKTDTGSTAPLCPYSSDYAPHAIGYIPSQPGEPVTDLEMKSYGCDEEALQSIGTPLDQEASVFKNFLSETDTFSRAVYDTVGMALNSLSTFLAYYNGTLPEDTPPVAQPAPPHETVNGCLEPYVPEPGSALPQEWEDLLATYPEYFDLWRSKQDVDGNIVFGPDNDSVLPVGLLFQPVVDFFRMDPMAMVLLRNYMDRRSDAGYFRPLPVQMATQSLDSYLSVITASDSQNDLRFISVNNEQSMAYLEAVNRDAYQKMKGASEPLHDAVAKLINVTDEFLPNTYVPDLTFFLARSCVDGHCQSTLDTVAKRIFNPYCTPYVSGLYLEKDAHKKCFCDPSIEPDWSDYKKYCTDDLSDDQSRLDALPPELFPGCLEDGFEQEPTATP